MKRPGWALHHSSMCQSLYARIITSTNSVSSFCTKNWPPRPGHDGKLSEASTPLTFMSRMRSCTSNVPGRTWSKLAGSEPQLSRGRPCTALRPKVAISWPSMSHASVPSSRRMTRGTRSLYLAGTWSCRYSASDGGSTMWSSTLTRMRSSVRIRNPRGRACRFRPTLVLHRVRHRPTVTRPTAPKGSDLFHIRARSLPFGGGEVCRRRRLRSGLVEPAGRDAETRSGSVHRPVVHRERAPSVGGVVLAHDADGAVARAVDVRRLDHTGVAEGAVDGSAEGDDVAGLRWRARCAVGHLHQATARGRGV